MTIKDTAILLIFLLSVLGLLLGVYLTDDTISDNSYNNDSKMVKEYKNGSQTISRENNNSDNLNRFFS